MADTETRTPNPETATLAPTRRKQLAIGAIAAAVLLVLSIATLSRDGGGRDPSPGPGQAVDEPITPGSGGAITPGGSTASCVEHYDLVNLAHREIAFDGTVTAIDGDDVRFVVTKWFRGKTAPTITLRGAAALGGLTSTGRPAALAPGTRLLVAGDGGFAWACGFTQPYDDVVAQQWEEVFGGR